MNREQAHPLNMMAPCMFLTATKNSITSVPLACSHYLLPPLPQQPAHFAKILGEWWYQRSQATFCAACLLKELTKCQKPPVEASGWGGDGNTGPVLTGTSKLALLKPFSGQSLVHRATQDRVTDTFQQHWWEGPSFLSCPTHPDICHRCLSCHGSGSQLGIMRQTNPLILQETCPMQKPPYCFLKV